MVANSAFLAAVVLLLGVSWLAARTTYLAPYKWILLREHGTELAALLLLLFANLFALFYAVARVLFLKDTGVKLHHLDRQLTTGDSVLTDLTRRIDN